MLELVSQDEAMTHLLIGPEHAPWLSMFIPAISEAVAGWLKDSWRLYEPELDSSGEIAIDSSGGTIPMEDSSGLVVKAVVKAAVVLELASTLRYKEGEGTNNVVPDAAGYGYVLNKASTAMLAPLRKSTVR